MLWSVGSYNCTVCYLCGSWASCY